MSEGQKVTIEVVVTDPLDDAAASRLATDVEEAVPGAESVTVVGEPVAIPWGEIDAE